MVNAVLVICGALLLAGAALLILRRYEIGAAVAMWSPAVQRSVAAGRRTPERVRVDGARYCAVPAGLFAAVAAAGLFVAAIFGAS